MKKMRFDEKQLKSVLKFLIKFNFFAIPLYLIIVKRDAWGRIAVTSLISDY